MRQSFIRKPVKAEIHRLQGSTTITLTGKAGDYVVTGRSPQILTPGRFRKEFMPPGRSGKHGYRSERLSASRQYSAATA